ncbi:MAG: hypothetical protein A2010_11770 [Nitrospirae bacterium GWD2_57_9]|nr:MAG: hypothetical protein A2010_11770 [Nitrospirae bacterium GWD2_57_9]OGW48147.1 MAG: hypothetical protein A2078_01085 [Nitrospirae bacterium GWC2_57_9]
MQVIFIFFLVLPSSLSAAAEKGLSVKGVRYFSYAAFTRVVFEIDAAAPYVLTKTSDSQALVLTAYDGPLTIKSSLPEIRDSVVKGIEARGDAASQQILIRLHPGAGDAKDFVLRAPDRIVLDITRSSAVPGPALPLAGKQFVIVLDPGHGGKDPGIVTGQGQEKSIALEMAQSIKKLLQKSRDLKVVLTRDRDIALTLDERAVSANQAGAVVFVSIHSAEGTGSRVFMQDPDDTLASQEQNPVSRDFLGFETGSEQQERLWGRQQAAHGRESGDLGRTLSRQLNRNDSAEPVQAPMALLTSVDAAAVLIEAGMEENRTRTAEAVAKGIELYVRSGR